MDFFKNLKIKMRLFVTMVIVSSVLLGLTFFTTKGIRDAVKSQIPLQVITTLNSECEKIMAIMANYEKMFTILQCKRDALCVPSDLYCRIV